ncbi:MAG: VTT domain-containing protein [Thermodesulfobacteriota bacterium]
MPDSGLREGRNRKARSMTPSDFFSGPLPRKIRDRLVRKLKALVWVALPAFALAFVFATAAGLLALIFPGKIAEFYHHVRMVENGSSLAVLHQAVQSAGPWGPVAFFGLQAAQVLVSPIPGQVTGFLAGLAFGFWKGLALSMAGLGAGSLLAMALGRFFGRVVVRAFVPARIMARYDTMIEQGGLGSFFLVFLLPLFPDDALCFLAGLSRLPLPGLFGVCIIGRLPGTAMLALAGADATSPYVEIAFAAALALGAVVWIFDEEARNLLRRLARKLGLPHLHQR